MIHENYGDDLDMTTDEEDNYHKLPPIPSINKYDVNRIFFSFLMKSLRCI